MDYNQMMNSEQEVRSLQPIGKNQQPDTIDLMDLAMNLLTHWWQILLAAVLCGAITFGYTYYRVVPQYRATAKIFVASSSSASALLTSSDLSWGNNTKADYAELLKCRPLLEQVAENLNLSRSASQLSRMITIGKQTDTRILTISVTSPYPAEAADIANELAKQSRTFMPEALKLEAPSFYETALVPSNKYTPDYSENTIMGALAGAAACAGFFVVLFLLNDSVTTPDDLLKYTGVQPLATIPEVETVGSKGYGKRYGKRYGYGRKGKKKDQPIMEMEDDSGEKLEALLNQKIRETEQKKDGDSK